MGNIDLFIVQNNTWFTVHNCTKHFMVWNDTL